MRESELEEVEEEEDEAKKNKEIQNLLSNQEGTPLYQSPEQISNSGQ